MTDAIEGGPPEPERRVRTSWLAGLSAVAFGALLTVVFVVVRHPTGARAPINRSSAHPTALASCTAGTAASALMDFVRAWNHRDAGAVAATLAPSAELDMSTRLQRARPPAVGGALTSTQGIQPILRFAHAQWDRGERLSYTRTQTFPSGIYARDLIAQFSGGEAQRMTEAKFAFDCSQAGFTHIVIVAAEVAH